MLHRHRNTDLWGACAYRCLLQKKQSYVCEFPESTHVHTEQCHSITETLTCTEHVHAEACWKTESSLTCEEEHEHTDTCYTEVQVAVCAYPESTHEHDDACHSVTDTLTCQEHEHTDTCCEETLVLVCDFPEATHVHGEECRTSGSELTCGYHQHSDTCFTDSKVLSCGITEENHQHNDACWQQGADLVCELTEHTHTLACYSDFTADTETSASWEQTLPNEQSGNWGEDLLATAKSQLNYTESSRNYLVAEDGVTPMGYNRYGAWYSSYTQDERQPYLDWNTTFLFFCIHYAGISDLPLEETCPEWIDSLDYYELYRDAAAYIPNPGDLVFADTDGDGEADRAGVFSSAEGTRLTFIMGDVEGAVSEVVYDPPEAAAAAETSSSDSPPPLSIVGYADIQQAQRQSEGTGEDNSADSLNNTEFTIYFAAPTNWASYTIKANVCQSRNENKWQAFVMSNTGATFTYGNTTYIVYSASVYEVYGGFDVIQFQRYSGETHQGQYVATENWLTKDALENKIYVNGTGFVEYTADSGGTETDTLPAVPSGKRRVFYDATLSKLSYHNDAGTATIPVANDSSSGSVIYCHYWDTSSNGSLAMIKLNSYTDGSSTWTNVYFADIPTSATNVLFYSSGSINSYPNNSSQTKDLTIPSNLTNPCFYGDGSDDVIYGSAKRGGYWDEAFRIRNAEAGKNTDVVDISSGTFTRKSDILYVNTTLYDYYSDYELNGKNRDDYPLDSSTDNINSHRIYQPFRHFNQALSMFYNAHQTAHPLYWGNFQADRYGTNLFSSIYDTLLLYDYASNNIKFFYENNAMMAGGGEALPNANSATQGLVDSTLSSSNVLRMSGQTAPFFNESFLSGNNALNTKLAEVYHNVQFPFVKKSLSSSDGGTVDYWYFDSADSSAANKYLQLKKSGSTYYLDSASSAINAQDSDGSTPLGYFPLNTPSQSGQATKLNYGFSQVFEIDFRLTENGTVKSTKGNDVPIEFTFSGDDDVWVFVDGQLVLDIGGDHGKVTGSINFQSRQSTVSSVKNSSGGSTSNKVTAFPSALNTSDFYASEHTLTMIYMERGLWQSNMRITFNFPDESLLEVEKHVDDSAVNIIFGDLFKNQDLFTYNIQTLATHYGTVEGNTGNNNDRVISVSASNLSAASGITVGMSTISGKEGVCWYTDQDDTAIANRSTRYGQINLSSPFALSGYQYLDFEFYYNGSSSDTPNLANVFIDLVDASGNSLLTNSCMSVSKGVVGSTAMSGQQWVSVRLDLNKMVKNSSTAMAAIRFGYDYGRSIYLRNFTFLPTTVVETNNVGFVMPQNEIPDYGTAASGKLAIPVGAVYTSSDGLAYRIGANGQFTLCDGESITFHDQFRRGSYIYLEEQSSYLYNTSWSMYEGRNETLVASSSVPSSATTVTGDGQSMTNVSGRFVTDGRAETIKQLAAEGSTGNAYQTAGSANAPGNTFVFRHYSNPDSTIETTKLRIVYTNTVKTGSLTIKKAQADGSEAFGSNQTFKFYVQFYNVGGMNLESEVITVGPYTLGVGDTQTISGIPLGTWFVIHEVKPSDNNIVLESVGFNLGDYGTGSMVPKNGTVKGNTSYAVDGLIPTTGSSSVSYTFNNSKKSVVSLTVKKEWDTSASDAAVSVPNAISVQLQRSTDQTNWTAVSGYENFTLQRGYTSWENYSYTFEDLDRYTDNSKSTEYHYRVVELDSSGNVISTNDTLTANGTSFKVTYSDVTNISDGKYAQTITNSLAPKAQFTVSKVWSGLDGAATPESITVQLQRRTGSNDFTAVESKVLSSADNWTHTFEGLDAKDSNDAAYTYRVVELDSSNNVIDANGTFTAGNAEYKVTYSNVTSDSEIAYSQTITNTLVPKVQVTVNKVWNDAGGAATPESITVQLQRSPDGNSWQPVSSQTLTSGSWSHTFTNLYKYVDFAAATKVAWKYRVVELDSSNNVINANGTFTASGVEYKVTYGDMSTADDTYTQTITNTVVPKVSLQLHKRDATNTETPLPGVVFRLEKNGGGFDAVTQTTDADGTLTFSGLKPGTYTLTETKTANGYSLLGAPVTIVIDESTNANGVITYTAKIDGESAGSFALSAGIYTLTLTVYNRQALVMPATGGTHGFEFWLLAGLLIMALPLLMYVFLCYKKGGKYLRK